MTGAGGSDLNTMLRGVLLLWREAAKYTALRASYKWRVSTVNDALKTTASQNQAGVHPAQATASDQTSKSSHKMSANLQATPSEVAARLGVVATGISYYLGARRPLVSLHPSRGPAEIIKDAAQAINSVNGKPTIGFVAPSEVVARLGVVATGISSYLSAHSPAVSQSLSHRPSEIGEASAQSINNVAADALSAAKTNLQTPINSQQAVNIEENINKGFASQTTSNSEPPGYDPIMDPTLAELDLETILATKAKPAPEFTPAPEFAPAPEFTPALDNFDLNASNSKLTEDLDVSHLLNQPGIDRLADDVRDIADMVRTNLDTTLQKTKEEIENFPDAVSGFQVTHEQLDAIEEKLQSLRGAAFIQELNTVEDQAQESASNIGFVLKAALSDIKPDESVIKNVSQESVGDKPAQQPVTAAVPLSSPAKPAKKSPKPKLLGRKPLAKEKPTSLLSESSRARAVPDSRIRRLMSFGGLAAGLGVGTIAEVTRRTLGVGGATGRQEGSDVAMLDTSPFLSEANANRIVDTLCKVRGAALKLGQMMSIQDNAFINPQLQQIFERVRQSADFMPDWQLQRILSDELGPDWKNRFAHFDTKPFAAASIGQVHEGVLPDGRRVAVKVQYPGVAEGIDSDINNLMTTLNYASIVPEGMFVESVMQVAKRELAWECDYERERLCGERYAKLVEPFPQYYVPASIAELCTKRILTTELIDGVPVDKCAHMDQDTRSAICNHILELTLRELFQFGYMQTDPNWANFFYNESTQQIALVDFGACRSYPKSFVDIYIKIIHGAASNDRDAVVRYSQQLGFLTGLEAKVMVEAHTDAVMILGETLQQEKPFSFAGQNTTQRIQRLLPTMVAHRMCPPPEEIYSLHRKMAGVYLLCARLQGSVNVQPLFMDLYRNYEYGGEWPEGPSTADCH